MTKLYIVGNGFDKHHNLPTGYDNFHKFVLNNHEDLKNIFEDYFRLSINENGLWSNFESDLGTFNWKTFFDDINNINIKDEKFKQSFIYSLEDDIKGKADELITKISNSFENWLNQINLDSIDKKFEFEEGACFLNFNYTLTLEKVYNIPSENIFHIHGEVDNNQDVLIFGHNEELINIPELDENGDSNRTIFSDSESAAKYPFYAFKKPVNEIISKNKTFFEKIRTINEIIIWEHSLNPIDIPYFKKIIKQTKKSTTWEISYFQEKEKETHSKKLQKIGIESSRIKLFKMN